MIKVFISYTHDSDEHCKKVEKLASFLIEYGVDVELDQYTPHPDEGWPIYMLRNILKSDFTLCVCTESYKARFEQDEKIGVGLGAKFEGKIITQIVYESEVNKKFIPILMDSTYDNIKVIPTILRSYQWYTVSEKAELANLYARITGQEKNIKPLLGSVISIDKLRKKLSLPTTTQEAIDIVTNKCIRRLIANGLTKDKSCQILKGLIESNKFNYLLGSDNRIVYVMGDFGSGKSLALSVLYIKKLQNGESAYFIGANQLSSEYSIEQYINIGKDNTPITVFIDGLDEVSFATCKSIIDDVNIISELNSNVNFVISSRPIQYLIKLYPKNIINIKELDRDESCDLIEEIAGGTAPIQILNGWGNDFWETVSNPFFAIICGKYLADKNGLFNLSKPEMISYLITSSIKKYDSEDNLKNQLELLSIRYIFNGMHKLLISDIDSKIIIDDILKTGLVQVENDYAIFNLPIIAQWLGAEAIKDGKVKIEDIIISDNYIASWRYSLMILVGNISYKDSFKILACLVKHYPGLVSTIIKDNIVYGKNESLPPAEECAKRIADCMEVWVNSIPSLAKFIAPVDHNSKPYNFKFRIDGDFTYIWWDSSYENKPYEVISTQPDKYCAFYSSRIPKTTIWPWIITFNFLSQHLKKLVKGKPFFVDIPELRKEGVYDIARKTLHLGSLYREDIKIDEVSEHIKKYGNGDPILQYEINKLTSYGQKVIEYPHLKPDNDYVSGKYVWDLYSKPRQILLAQEIYLKGLQSYQQLCDGLFNGLNNVMPMRLMLPADLKMEFYYSDSMFGKEPCVRWWLICKNSDQHNSVSLINEKESKIDLGSNMNEIFKDIQSSIMQYRVKNHSLCPITIHSEILNIFNELPLTRLVISWLKHDLIAIDWI